MTARLSIAALALALLVAPRIAAAQTPTAEPAHFDPYRRGGAEILLPILNYQGPDDVCDSWIDVQNVGAEDCKVALVTWGESGFCPPQAAGPLKVECTGIIRPGASWTMSGAQIPTGSRGGVLYRLSAEPYDGFTGFDRDECCTLGDYVCELLFFGLVGDADDTPRFVKAYRQGLAFQDLDMRIAAGTGALAAAVTRRCPGSTTPSAITTASYNAIAFNRVGDVDPVQGGYVAYAPDAHVVTGGDGQPGVAGGTTFFYVQNAGLRCASVDIWFAARDGCGRSRLCASMTMASLETLHLDSAECGPPNGPGTMWVRSTQPVAVVAERVVGDASTTVAGVPSTIGPGPARGLPAPRPIGAALSAPYVANGAGGLTTSLVVQNLDTASMVRVRIAYIDLSGVHCLTIHDWLCPRGSAVYDTAALHGLPAGWRGSARVSAVDGPAFGATNDIEARLAGVARLEGADGRAQAYELAAAAGSVPMGRTPGDLDAVELAAGLIALPAVNREGLRGGTEIVVANAAGQDGFTELVVFVYDANGLVDRRCDRLVDEAGASYDVAAWAPIGTPFRGSAIVSAWFWEHDTFDERGFFIGNSLGIAAAVVTAGEQLPPDGAAPAAVVRLGVPLRWVDAVVPVPWPPMRHWWLECPDRPFYLPPPTPTPGS